MKPRPLLIAFMVLFFSTSTIGNIAYQAETPLLKMEPAVAKKYLDTNAQYVMGSLSEGYLTYRDTDCIIGTSFDGSVLMGVLVMFRDRPLFNRVQDIIMSATGEKMENGDIVSADENGMNVMTKSRYIVIFKVEKDGRKESPIDGYLYSCSLIIKPSK